MGSILIERFYCITMPSLDWLWLITTRHNFTMPNLD
jgi:hypothetical protein